MQFAELVKQLRQQGREVKADQLEREVCDRFSGVLDSAAVGKLEVDDVAEILQIYGKLVSTPVNNVTKRKQQLRDNGFFVVDGNWSP